MREIADDVSASGPQSVRTVSQRSNVKIQRHFRYLLFFFIIIFISYFFVGKSSYLKSLGNQTIVCSLQSANVRHRKLFDRLYFEFIEEMYGNVENPRIIVLDCDKYSHLTSK